MRSQSPEPTAVLAQRSVPAAVAPLVGATPTNAVNVEPDSYVVPKNTARRLVVPSTELANYVVAHSEFSSPVARRNLLSAFMASESGTAAPPTGSEEPTEDVQDDAKIPQ
jgi:sigma-E factor negative regulatory protein RseA